jgi:hypothetical protein
MGLFLPLKFISFLLFGAFFPSNGITKVIFFVDLGSAEEWAKLEKP